jgi:hypothetical protein
MDQSTQANLQQADLRLLIIRLYINLGVDVSPATRQPRQDRLHQHRPWSSSPTTIYINKLHQVAAITTHGQR